MNNWSKTPDALMALFFIVVIGIVLYNIFGN